jgi:hypothetical protein
MILHLAKFGNHNYGAYQRFQTDADVALFFEQVGVSLDALVEQCRDWKEFVPHLENLVGGTVHIEAGGSGSITMIDSSSGEDREIVTFRERGQVFWTTYRGLFEKALEALERGVNNADWGDVLLALSGGVASVEAFISQCAEAWNARHPEDPLVDTKHTKVSFEDKVTTWIPKMAGGLKLHRGDQVWRDFAILQAIRDKQAIHPKSQFVGATVTEMVATINRFRSIARLLIRLHVLFKERVPSQVVRAAFAPDVEEIKPPAAAS